MKLRTTLAVLAIGLLAWLAIRLLGEPPQPPSARLPLVPADLVAEWDEIDLDLLSDQDLRILREPGAVTLRFGSDREGRRLLYSDPVDVDRLTALLQALRDSLREPLQGDPDDLLRAGLDPPRFHLTIRRGSGDAKQEVALGFGNDDPTGRGVLARCYGDGTFFRTGPQVPNLLMLNLKDWRSKTVFGLDAMGVDRIDRVKYHGAGGEPELLTLEKEGPRSWRIVEPRSLMADATACQSLAQQATLLRVQTFVSQAFDPLTIQGTGLPENPRWSLQLSSGLRVLELEVGDHLAGQGYACRMRQRGRDGETTVFTVSREALDPILEATVDSLRPRRLFPRIESTLVALGCREADGATLRWSVEREGRHRSGAWMVRFPFEGRANDGKGTGSFAQVVVDLDRTEIHFLPPETPFEREATLELAWRADPVLETRTLELARDRSGGRTLVRDARQPDELFAVPAKLGELIDLDLELHRDRTVFPREEAFRQRLVLWRLSAPGRETLEVVKKGLAPEASGTTPDSAVAALTSAASEVIGAVCAAYVRAGSALAVPGASDPFATVAFELTLGTHDGERAREETLVVSGAPPDAQPPDGIYCRMRGRLPDDVWMIVPRAPLDALFRLRQ